MQTVTVFSGANGVYKYLGCICRHLRSPILPIALILKIYKTKE
ncbi:hypothetical protein [Microcoleus sp.]